MAFMHFQRAIFVLYLDFEHESVLLTIYAICYLSFESRVSLMLNLLVRGSKKS
jgi:hypothetical protein